MAASIKIVLRKRKLLDGSYPLALRITKDRKTSFIHIGKNVLEDQWDATAQRVKKSHPNSGKLNSLILDKLKEYNDLLLDLEKQKRDTTSASIKRSIKKGEQNFNFFPYAYEYLEALKSNNKLSRHSGESPRIKYLKKFVGSDQLIFQDITPTFLEKFSTYLKSDREVSERTVMNYLVVVRTIYNKAIKEGLVDRKYYPFADNNIKIKYPPSIKIGLTVEEVKEIENLDLEQNTPVWHTRNVWLTSFYFAGMRISDVIKLKWLDFIDDRMIYRMNKNQKISSIKVPEKMRPILEFYEPDKRSKDDFVFPELKEADPKSPADIFAKTNTAIKKFNDCLSEIAALAKIDKKITNHIARHTFGNISGDKISPQMLQKLYRHSDLKTTIGYQANFIHKEADEALETVMNF
jgi:integrase